MDGINPTFKDLSYTGPCAEESEDRTFFICLLDR